MSFRDIHLVLASDDPFSKTTLLGLLAMKTPRSLRIRLGRTRGCPDYTGRMEVDGVRVAIGCKEMSIKHRIHPPGDVVIIFFNLMSQISFENVTSKWYPDIKKFYKKIPIILVGSRLDLRRKEGRWIRYLNLPIDTAQGEALAVSINAIKYFEVSSDFDETEPTQLRIMEGTVRAVFRKDQEKLDNEKEKEEVKNKIKIKCIKIFRNFF